MMRNVLLLALLLTTGLLFAQQRHKFEKHELTSIIQKCLSISELQPYYTVDGIANKPVNGFYVQLQQSLQDLSVVKAGKTIRFQELPIAADQLGDAFFVFKSWEAVDNSGTIVFEFNWTAAGKEKGIEVTVDLSKNSEGWNVSLNQIQAKKNN